jgi:hypothetical protein
MKQIGALNVDDVPVGMRIYKNGKYYEAVVVRGKKQWQPLPLIGGGGGGAAAAEAAAAKMMNLRPEQHSWTHHHAPMYQVFNDYVCLKKDTLGELRDFLLVVSNLGK